MKLQKYISKVLDVLTALVVLLFFASFGFKDSRTSGWYQQFFPNLNGSTITSMTFLDSLTGFAVTNSNSLLQEYIVKTTNGGDNWFINYINNTPGSNWSFIKIKFINSNTGYAFTWAKRLKTTNRGITWDSAASNLYAEDYAILNEDTMIAVTSSGFDGGVYRSINGGLNWQLIWGGGGSGMPSNIYMFNRNLGFTMSTAGMRRTSDGGFNWTIIPGENYSGIQMVDTLIGWKTAGSSLMMKTTNGGLNWFPQQVPNFNNGYNNPKLSVLNFDTVWMVGEIANPGPLFKTTNGGLNWGYQFPGSYLVSFYDYINFIDNKKGWSYRSLSSFEIHTKIGGNDTTIFTSINNNISNIPDYFILFQNYPNPFNAETKIKFDISNIFPITRMVGGNDRVILTVYDISGSKVITLLNEILQHKEYEVIFDGNNLSSGIYFYQLTINDEQLATKKMILLK